MILLRDAEPAAGSRRVGGGETRDGRIVEVTQEKKRQQKKKSATEAVMTSSPGETVILFG